ncbi:unnamed protein product [Ostreobium quekettii]|uniref:Uncharacterized protein n=1 Tax=Ostreobium quekettii TaxID=121088 RepID=A0A8S1JER8_9CHLO|nr:unnamed protein product [Ostreobium quekettii]|eukprot:evm.model.scf_916.1 EVM.evm.TU.scf_916.1   scf_916:19608-20387(-)
MLKASDSAVAASVNTVFRRLAPPSLQLPRPCPFCRPARSPSAVSPFVGTRVPRGLRRAAPWLAQSRVPHAVQIRAAIFGVGAPEAIVVVVVAMLVFGPRGLASAAKSFGAALRSFQPTIRELAEVSTDLKSTLEQEMGLDELRDDIRAIRSPLSAQPSPPGGQVAARSEEGLGGPAAQAASRGSDAGEDATGVVDAMMELVDADIDQKRADSERLAWGGQAPEADSGERDLSAMSVAELEAELARRKAQGEDGQDSNYA